MKLTRMACLSVAMGLSTFAQADFIGLKGDIGYWNFDGHTQTDFKYGGAEFSQTHDLDRQGAVQFSVAFEHPVPVIPNVKLKYVNLDNDSKDGLITSETKLKNIDYILYYEILDNIVSADIGIGVTNLEGSTTTNFASPTAVLQYAKHDISGYSPILYAQAGVKLPFTGLSTNAELVYTSFDDTEMTDLQADLQYDFVKSLVIDVGAKVGYRYMKIDIESGNENLQYEFKGPYLGLAAHF